jgi:hypothetical protein
MESSLKDHRYTSGVMSEPRKLGFKQALIGAMCLALGSMVLSWVYVTFIEGDEAKVQRVISFIVVGAEARSPRAVTATFTDDFKISGQRDGVGKDEVHRALARVFLVDYKFGFELTLDPDPIPVEVAESGETATCSFTATARGQASKDGDWIQLRNREANGSLVYKASFRKTQDGWRLHGIRFEKPLSESRGAR